MQFLKQSTGVDVRIGPFVDVSDGYTPETGVTLSGADEAELLKHNGAATVDISSNTWAAVTGCDGWYDLTLTTGNTDTLGLLEIVVQDDSVCLPVHARFMVVAANFYDSICGSDKLQVDTVEVEGSDATDQIRDAVVDDATQIDASALNALSGKAPSASYLLGSANADGSGYSTHDDPGPDIAALNDPTAAAIADSVLDELVADHAGAGSTGEALGHLDADVSSRSSHDDPGPDIAALNDPTAAAIADSVLEEVLADHSGTAGSLAEAVELVADILEGDVTIDTTTTPWQLVVKEKGTSTELVRKDLKQADGTNVTSTDHLVGQQTEPA
ncbi:MAG: hypothetical protein PVH68_04755 [Armatimonadota bacterium]|jgi:hypothetical protein